MRVTSGLITRGRVITAVMVGVAVAAGGTAGVAGGTVLTPPGWAAAMSRFDIDATSGFSRLTVHSW